MSDWKKAIENLNLTDSKDLETAKRLFVEYNRANLIAQIPEMEDNEQILDTFGAIREYNNFIERSERPQPALDAAPSLDEIESYRMKFLIDNWMPANRLTLFTGPGGTGKSYMALQYVIALASGVKNRTLTQNHNLLPPDKEPIKIIVASYEEDLIETWSRIHTICRTLGWANYEMVSEQIKFVDLKMFGPLWGVQEDTHLATRSKMLETGKWLFDQCVEFEASLLMLDPSAGAYGGSEISRESVREFCSFLNGWGQENECATLLISHPPKTGADYSGSTDWLGSCRALWTLKPESYTEGTGPSKVTIEWYQLGNAKQNYTAPQRAIPVRKIKSHSTQYFTPVWEGCTQEEAIDFYQQYNHLSDNKPIAESKPSKKPKPPKNEKEESDAGVIPNFQ